MFAAAYLFPFISAGYINKALIESSLWMRRIALPNSSATLSWVILEHFLASLVSWIESVTTSSSNFERSKFSIAGPLKTG
jgi:hypothetical protein